MGITYPVKPVTLPKDMKGLENGKLPANLLKDIKPFGKMHHLAANAWEAMRCAAKAEGIELCHVGDYRPYEAQLAMFKERYVKGDSKDPRKITRTFNGETWMLKKGMAPAGSPGTSNHGWGLAIDVALKVGGKVVSIMDDPDGKGKGVKSGLEWLFANADKFGFSWEIKEGAQAEAWHIRYYPGDKVPAAVTAHFNGAPAAPAAAAAAPAAAPAAGPAARAAKKAAKKAAAAAAAPAAAAPAKPKKVTATQAAKKSAAAPAAKGKKPKGK